MKTNTRFYRVNNAPKSFASFLMALSIPFHWNPEDTYGESEYVIRISVLPVPNPSPKNFLNYCRKNGVRECDLKDFKVSLF